jgi:hypothetical protein
MMPEPVSTPGSQAMESIAEHFASELNAQFRTLNHFVGHAGEIGRAHETFLRGVLARFLPGHIQISSGFVASPKWTSRQQDILIHRRDFTTLLEVGDCTVIDHEAFVGTIEVKTDLASAGAFRDAVESQAEFRHSMRHSGLHGIYAWDGVSFDTTLNALWDFVRVNPTKHCHSMPDLVYVRGKYLLMANHEGCRESSPYHVWHVGQGGITEGQALLGVVASVWRFGLQEVFPWWLLSWHARLGMVAHMLEDVTWPGDLRDRIVANPAT